MILKEIETLLENKSPLESLVILSERFKDKIAFSTSFSLEDQVITDMIFTNNLPIRIFTLDTGRLFEETYKVLNRTREKYNKEIDVYFPENNEVEALMRTKGAYSFYESVDNRKECCRIRKVNPLKRALQNTDCWITGLRGGQSESRGGLSLLQWDEGFGLLKYNPLLDWALDEVNQYLSTKNVPYNILYDRNFLSIGCSPCTRALREGEDIRAGRWWWEDTTKKECGLHER